MFVVDRMSLFLSLWQIRHHHQHLARVSSSCPRFLLLFRGLIPRTEEEEEEEVEWESYKKTGNKTSSSGAVEVHQLGAKVIM